MIIRRSTGDSQEINKVSPKDQQRITRESPNGTKESLKDHQKIIGNN